MEITAGEINYYMISNDWALKKKNVSDDFTCIKVDYGFDTFYGVYAVNVVNVMDVVDVGVDVDADDVMVDVLDGGDNAVHVKILSVPLYYNDYA